MIPTAMTKSHFAGALAHPAQLQAVLLVLAWLWAAGAVTQLSFLSSLCSAGMLLRWSTQGCTASTAFQALCSLPQLLRKAAPHHVGSCMDTGTLFFPTPSSQEGRDPP